MYAFYRLIAIEVTNVNRNFVCVCVCARACVRVHMREWTGVRRPTKRKLYTNA